MKIYVVKRKKIDDEWYESKVQFTSFDELEKYFKGKPRGIYKVEVFVEG